MVKMWCVLYVHLDVFKIQMFCIKQIDEFGRSGSERRSGTGRPFEKGLHAKEICFAALRRVLALCVMYG